MAKVLYTADAAVTGGRDDGHGRTSDGTLEVDIRVPEELGGPGGGPNPEQLFAVGYGACFGNAVKRVAQRERVDPGEVAVDAKVMLVPGTGEGRRFELEVALDVRLSAVQDTQQAARIVRAAHEVCPYSNATRGNVDVALTANGEPV